MWLTVKVADLSIDSIITLMQDASAAQGDLSFVGESWSCARSNSVQSYINTAGRMRRSTWGLTYASHSKLQATNVCHSHECTGCDCWLKSAPLILAVQYTPRGQFWNAISMSFHYLRDSHRTFKPSLLLPVSHLTVLFWTMFFFHHIFVSHTKALSIFEQLAHYKSWKQKKRQIGHWSMQNSANTQVLWGLKVEGLRRWQRDCLVHIPIPIIRLSKYR